MGELAGQSGTGGRADPDPDLRVRPGREPDFGSDRYKGSRFSGALALIAAGGAAAEAGAAGDTATAISDTAQEGLVDSGTIAARTVRFTQDTRTGCSPPRRPAARLGRLTADTPTSGGGGYAFSYASSTGTIASDGTSGYAWDPSGGILVGTGAVGGGTGGALALTDIHRNQAGQFTASGTSLAGSKAYDPWGNLTGTSGSITGMLGYQSAWSDPASGKNLMGARWYSPAAGDFTSADTVHVSPDPDPAAGNPFAYAADNPLTGTDPTGHCPVDLCGAGINNNNTTAMAQVAKAVNTAAAKAKAAAATAAATAHAAHLAHLAHLAVVAKAAPVAAKIPTYCAGNNIGAMGTCMSAVYRAAGGAVNASGVPTTSGSSYNPKLASVAMGIVKAQFNAVQDATQKRDAARQQADAKQQAARQQAASQPGTAASYCDPADQKAAMCTPGGGRITNPYWPSMTGTTRDGWAGLLSNIPSLIDAGCTVNPACLAERMLGVPSAGQLYQKYVNTPLNINASSDRYKGARFTGMLGLIAAGGAAAEAGAAGEVATADDAATALTGTALEDVGTGAGTELVPYSPQFASRNLLNQLGEGYGTTPAGRTLSAHAADRVVNGAAGRVPTTLERVDDVLDNPTGLRYSPTRDTVRVSQGKAFVVISGTGPGQHVVTVMIP